MFLQNKYRCHATVGGILAEIVTIRLLPGEMWAVNIGIEQHCFRRCTDRAYAEYKIRRKEKNAGVKADKGRKGT